MTIVVVLALRGQKEGIGMGREKERVRGAAVAALSCRSSIEHEDGRLVLRVDCRSCSGGKASLNDGLCFNGVVEAFAEGMATDAVVLSGRNETQYTGPPVEMVRRVAEMRRGLDRLSSRVVGLAASGRRCDRCPANPSLLFGDLSQGLAKGVGPFYESLRIAVAHMEATAFDGGSGCDECAKAALDDLHFLAVEYEDFVKFVLKEGFSVVL